MTASKKTLIFQALLLQELQGAVLPHVHSAPGDNAAQVQMGSVSWGQAVTLSVVVGTEEWLS
jgi:hypothetical protein